MSPGPRLKQELHVLGFPGKGLKEPVVRLLILNKAKTSGHDGKTWFACSRDTHQVRAHQDQDGKRKKLEEKEHDFKENKKK